MMRIRPSTPADMTSTNIVEEALTVEEALSRAIGLQQKGQLDQAATIYRQALSAAPDHPALLHFAGVLAHQQGRSAEAEDLMRRSLALRPEEAGWHSNLGIVLKVRGKLDEAASAYRTAIRLDPGNAGAHVNLGVLLRAQGRKAEAEEAYRTAIRLAPDHAAAYQDLGVLLAATGRAKEAVLAYSRALVLDPSQQGTRTLLARAYYVLGEREKAIELYERWLQEEPGNPEATHMLAACSGRDVPARASDRYVERIFDVFSASFEAKLAALEYRAPQLVAAAIADAGLEPSRRLAVLDAGCGTGLCGPLVAPYAARLVGVDLSAGMLRLAKEKGVYDELVKDELTAHLRAHPAAYDLIVSADTLCYFGALEEVVSAAARALRLGGLLVFTLEALADEAGPAGFRLEPHGRYSHRRAYVAQLLAGAGLEARLTDVELRMEAGARVAGLLACGVRP